MTGYRIQGTDGIRREVRYSSSEEFSGLTPQQVFLERGFITEEFMELYAYAHVSQLLSSGEGKGDTGGRPVAASVRSAIVVGWDPRDVRGMFTDAVMRGVRKAGADVLCIGIAPTPLVPTYMLYKNARGGFMVTASHNPKDQNGIKTFYAFRGMKLLPHNDIELTRSILALDYKSIAEIPLTGDFTNCRSEAMEVFTQFSLNPENSWITSASFKHTTLVVDPANGALSGIAAEIFSQAGFGHVIEVNGSHEGDVNLYSGVADLEGHKRITSVMIDPDFGLFRKHKAVLKMFEFGRRYQDKILAGKHWVSGAVFDADGDRFYRLDYCPAQDEILVLSGDETAFMQAQYLMTRDPDRYKGAIYINTVESDLNAGLAAEELGLKLHLAAVGDKWILLRIATLIAETRIKSLLAGKRKTREALALRKKLRAGHSAGILDVHEFRKIEAGIDRLSGSKKRDMGFIPLAVGSEETGHNITLGWLDTESGNRVPVFFGNGLKSALNTFAATEYLTKNKTVPACLTYLSRPFKPGFKQTYYVYYVVKELFYKNSAVWRKIKQSLFDEGKKLGYRCALVSFREDPDMLYVNLKPRRGLKTKTPSAGIFIRNSGTENKIGVNLRGDLKDAAKLRKVGERLTRHLFSALKDTQNRFYEIERDLLSRIMAQPIQEDEIAINAESRARVLNEMKRQGLIKLTPKGFQLSSTGKWYTEISRITKKNIPSIHYPE